MPSPTIDRPAASPFRMPTWATRTALALSLAAGVPFVAHVLAAPRQVTFGAVASPVKVKDAFVVTVTVEAPDAKDCTTDVVVTGDLRLPGHEPIRSKGTCESPDGGTFRVRFVPPVAGDYDWTVIYA